jgi:AcrR family transcriptional regulator
MRITAKAKKETRTRILETARKLFLEKGFEQTTTRDIASLASIAAGTLFNYFPSKEELGTTLLAEALDEAKSDFLDKRRGEEDLAELLFAHAMAGLRVLAPYRTAVAPIIEVGMSPFASNGSCEGNRIRSEHLETVADLIANSRQHTQPSFVVMHLYWTLYLGVLAFWSGDESPNQEDTLAILDQSMRLFVSSLNEEGVVKEDSSDE